MKKIGLFGGTFNPIHIGHLNIAKTVYETFNLDELHFIPSKIPPHKNLWLTPAKDRFEMVKAAVKHMKGNYVVSDYEIKKKGVSYTYLTLKHYRQNHPGAQLFFITGTDIFATIQTWNNWEKLFDLANFIVINRKELSFVELISILPKKVLKILRNLETFENTLYGRVVLCKANEIDISSTKIRNMFKTGKMSSFLPNPVIEYIKKNNLYKEV
ncbi:nicotinate-nucleotide adenylyltransferase [Deferribacterales bacterium Es71-Z0220]|uniref:nicotinate-nucleotide adenylyltransferase n=1 Tax=Deferrivibrio essentukiensis TaxID=2880922 RepID=UPI001F619CED|nr:nicotinate-nucleotide adenylyltransferase [Deferrivibrio essentukiensis]MCB4204095.1 nicotinate-nucleotide adenylyltransferase [Deferrivibrio essentukiensis]